MSTNAIEITWEKSGQLHIVRLQGRLDITHSEEFEKSIKTVMEEDPRDVVINLARVTYMSSSGVRAILAIFRALGKMNLRMALCEASPVVRKVLDVVEIGQILSIFERERDAIASMQD